jgi:gluconate 2-dehydrogenase alpha chain
MSGTASTRAPADVVLVGIGGANGIVAHVLTAAGVRVTALEAGGRVDASMMTLDEIRNDVRAWLAPKSLGEFPTWRPTAADPAGTAAWRMVMANVVGGSTVHYPALSARLQPWNFESRSRAVARYGAARIPRLSTLADWPLGYAELEPYYDRVEHEIGVAGRAGNIRGEIVAGGNPYEGQRARGYPMPPLRRSGWTELLASAAERLGWHPFPAPVALNTEPYNGGGVCTYCGFCSSNGCHANAKGSTDRNVIPKAEETGLLDVVTNARVVRIDVDRNGAASGVTFVKDGREQFQPARVVILGTFTYENTRLLLLSTSSAFPHGLANNAGQVGKHFMTHLNTFVFGQFPGRRLNLYSGPWSQSTCVDDWNGDNFDHRALGFIGGGMLTASHELKPIAMATNATPPWVPRWGSAWKAWFADSAQSVGMTVGQLESLSYETTYLDLDPTTRDVHGLPVVRLTYRIEKNEQHGYEFLRQRLTTWLREAGAVETWTPRGFPAEAQHAYGGTRMGDDPTASVVDRYGFAHEVPNLGVVGASVFPTTGGHNPTLTVQALAWRTAAHLVESWESRAG